MNYTIPAISLLLALGVTEITKNVLPVTANMRPTEEVYADGTYSARVIGRKILDCQVLPGSFQGWYYNDLWVETPFAFIDDPSPNSSNPSGLSLQSFGTWRWSDLPPGAEKVRLTLTHDCPGFRVSVVGPFDLPEHTKQP